MGRAANAKGIFDDAFEVLVARYLEPVARRSLDRRPAQLWGRDVDHAFVVRSGEVGRRQHGKRVPRLPALLDNGALVPAKGDGPAIGGHLDKRIVVIGELGTAGGIADPEITGV